MSGNDDNLIRVLLVEDNPGDARLLREALAEVTSEHFELTHAITLSEGMERLSADRTDVVLLDLSLPDASGLDTFIRLHACAPSVPFVVLTGLADETVAAAALREGAQDYLVKGQVDSNLLSRSMRYAIERMRTEEALRENEGKYRALFEDSRDAIFVSDAQGIVIDANQAALDLFGFTREQALGSDVGDRYLHDADRDRFREDLSSLGGVRDFEVPLMKRDGTVMECLLTATRRRDEQGNNLGIQGLVRDITERKRAEEALRESEERFRRLVEDAADGFLVIEPGGGIIDVNQMASQQFGFSREELLTMSVEDIYITPDEVVFTETFVLFGPGEPMTLEGMGKRKDGSTFPIEMRSGLIELAGSQHMFALVRDITERKRAEERLLDQTRELAVLGERNRMAREIHDTLAQGFTGIVIQIEAAEQAMSKSPGELPDHLTLAKKLGRDSLQEARRSVWNLLPQALEQLPLDAALEAEVNRFPGNGRERVFFTVSGDKRDLPANLQAALLRVCQESLTNVRRHAAATEIKVALTFYPDAVFLGVQDDGIGFDVEAVRASGKEHSFGLAGMEGRIHPLGGTYQVASGHGQGTRVEVWVPTGGTWESNFRREA